MLTKINKFKYVCLCAFVIIFICLVKNYSKPTIPPSTQPQQIPWREPIKINNDISKSILLGKVIVDVVIPLRRGNELKRVMDQLKSWDDSDALPCTGYDKFKSRFYSGSTESNLIFYLNTVGKKENEETSRIRNEISNKVESAIWRKCFNQIKFIHYTDGADNGETVSKPHTKPREEERSDTVLTDMFYRYFKVGSTSDYFFWMETDVHVLRKNWQIELFRLVTETITTRNNLAFYMMGGNYVGDGLAQYHYENYFEAWDKQLPLYINANALYWNSRSFYDGFLDRVKNSSESTGVFDADIAIFLKTRNNWGIVKNIRTEFITLDFIRNYNHDHFDKQEILVEHSRTYFAVQKKNQ